MPTSPSHPPDIAAPSIGRSRPRCAFVESYPHVIAGQQRTMLSLLETWQAYGDSLLLTPGSGVFVDEARSRGVETEILSYGEQLGRYSGAIYNDGIFAKLKTYREGLRYVLNARKLLKSRRVDAVFCNDMRGLLTIGAAAKMAGIPAMIWDKLDKPHGKLDWFQLPLAQKNPVISKAVLTKYPGWQKRWYSNRIDVVPNGADLAKFERAIPMRAELGLTEEDFVVGIIGTVTYRKGVDRLMAIVPEVAVAVPRLKVLVVGSWEDSDEDRAYYEQLSNRDHPAVQFLGFRSDAERIIKSLSVLVIPSRHEGMGQVTAEAMSCSVPVVGANAGGIPEVVVHNETGFIFEGDDHATFGQQLIQLGQSGELCQRLGTAGRVRAEEFFNRPRQMQKICQMLGALVKR